jgi:hypothetical protein
VEKCRDCMKPRCVYYLTSPSMMKPLAVQGEAEPTYGTPYSRVPEAKKKKKIYVCGM